MDKYEYSIEDWQEECEGRKDDPWFLTILDPDNEEYAIIIHRTCNGRFPLDGELANSKVRRAHRIMNALNATLPPRRKART